MFRREVLLMTSVFLMATNVGAQDVDRSSFPQGMRVQGDAEPVGYQESISSSATTMSRETNTSRNSSVATGGSANAGGASATGAGVQIQGKTRLTAEQKGATATAVGKDNAVKNEVGVIGGK